MQAVILVGGFGTRLKEILPDLPKPMAPILGKPFLEHLLYMLKQKGISNFIFCTGYLADKIKDYFGDGKNFDMHITYSHEITPLFSGGALKNAERFLEEDFLVINGDNYVDIDYIRLLEYHTKNAALITIAIKELDAESVCHTLRLEEEKVIAYYGGKKNNLANAAVTGVFVINKKIIKSLKKVEPLSLEKDLIPMHLPSGKVFGLYQKSYFIDIGTPTDYVRFISDFNEHLSSKKF